MQKFVTDEITRRGFFGGLAFVAGSVLGGQRLFGAVTSAGAAARSGPAAWNGKITGLGSTGDVYTELGVTKVINAQGTETVLGGSLIRPEALAVMQLAAKQFVVMMDLEAAAGKRIAELLKLPAGYSAIVTSGAASAIQNGYSGILTGNNAANILQIPDLTGMKSEVIVQKAHVSGWDHQIRATGAKIVEVETVEDVHKAVSERTAAMHFLNLSDPDGKIKRADWVKLAHAAGVPAFLDMAADVPPKTRPAEYAEMGYDLIALSGGKAIRGPQNTGLLIGRAELVHNALLNMSPNEDTLGRPEKVAKEDLVGLLKALELYMAEDQEMLDKEQWRKLNTVADRVAKISGVKITRDVPEIANRFPTLQVRLDPNKFSAKPNEIAAELEAMKPIIFVSDGPGLIEMTAIDLQLGEDTIVADALYKVLKAHSA
jgi:seryl-tRNA(Sec) selenium transferase